jgi:leucyl-tRNA synthetase
MPCALHPCLARSIKPKSDLDTHKRPLIVPFEPEPFGLQTDPALREEYNITEEMVKPFDVVPIISIPGGCPSLKIEDFGPCAAVTCCEKLKVKDQHDKKKLKLAKDACYLRGFNFGVMQVGSQKGKPVSEAKDIVKEEMLSAGLACKYYEPAEKVMSRSGDECVVAMLQQWYLTYGEEGWRDAVMAHVKKPDGFSAYTDAARRQVRFTAAPCLDCFFSFLFFWVASIDGRDYKT